MSFTFGNTSCRIGTVERMSAIVGGNAHVLREQFLKQWHSPRALHLDFAKMGLDPATLSVTLDDCTVSYEYADAGHVVFLTEYHSSASMEKDREFIAVADSHGCVRRSGLAVAITMDAATGAAFRSALLRARK